MITFMHDVPCRQPRRVVVRAGGDETVQLTGVVFAPFSEVGADRAREGFWNACT